jgi:hypothetical protein
MGLEPAKKILQIDNIDDEFKNRLWNIFSMDYLIKLKTGIIYYMEQKMNLLATFVKIFGVHFIKKI